MTTPPESAVRDASDGRWRGFVLALMLGSALCAAHPIHDADAFWHMTLGRAVLEQRARVLTEPVAFESFTDLAVVPEWLWGVVTLGLYRLGGFAVLSVLPVALAALCAACMFLLARTRQAPGMIAASMLTSSAGMAVALSRMRTRPQAAFLVLLPAFLWVARRYVAATGQARVRLGAVLVALALLWAQLHGSFVLAPVLFAIEAGAVLRSDTARDRTASWAVLLCLVLTLLSSAYGLDIGGYILAHRAGDATRHILDMMPPSWQVFNPATHFYGPVYAALWLLGAAGALMSQRLPRVELCFALLSLWLGLSSVRFFAESVALVVPWATCGACGVLAHVHRAPVWPRIASALVSIALLAGTARAVNREYGPLGRLGLSDADFPLAAAARLASAPAGSAALSTFSASAPLGFLLSGRVRTYVDGRTPLYFDDTDYALSRDVFARPEILPLAIARYQVSAVVLERGLQTCEHIPTGFRAVALDPRFTTYAAQLDGPSFELIAACGPRYLTPDACVDSGRPLDREIAQLERLHSSSFTRFLRAARIALCGGDLSEARKLLGRDGVAGHDEYARQRRMLLASLFVREREVATALDLLEGDVRAGRLDALDMLGPAIVRGGIPPARARGVLEAVASTLDDQTPPYVRNALAHLCMAQGDAECVRFQAPRAALGGAQAAQLRAGLVWLTTHHPAERVREDARRWLQTLQAADARSQNAP